MFFWLRESKIMLKVFDSIFKHSSEKIISKQRPYLGTRVTPIPQMMSVFKVFFTFTSSKNLSFLKKVFSKLKDYFLFFYESGKIDSSAVDLNIDR